MLRRNGLGWLGLVLFALVAAPLPAGAQGLSNLFGSSVAEISTEKLIDLMGDKEAMKRVVLVDVRSDAETGVSVLPGAITKAEYEATAAKHQDKRVIVYCTVGGRSGAYAKQLAGKKVDVVNYKGSILEWVAAEQPLETLERKPTKRVHTYSSRYQVPAGYQAVH